MAAIEKVLTTVPMGGSAKKDLVQARRVLADRLYLLEVERETNPTVAAFVEAKRSKGDKRDLAAAVDKYTKMKKSEKASSSVGAGGASARGAPGPEEGTTRPQDRPFLCICRRQQPPLLLGTRSRPQGPASVSTAWNQVTGGERQSVRRRVNLELVFYCVGIHCMVFNCCSIYL
jgi:hypothetical protein